MSKENCSTPSSHVEIEIDEKDKIQEKCGIVILVNYKERKDNIILALAAAQGVQHRGQQGVGLMYVNNETNVVYKQQGLISEVFGKKEFFTSNQGAFNLRDGAAVVLVHTRYGTEGGYDSYNIQPCEAVADNGDRVRVIHNGNLVAVGSIREKVKAQLPPEVSDTYIFTQLLAESEGENWDKKVLATLDKISGAYSMGISIEGVTYLARDRHGLRPFVIGELRGGWIATSETRALKEVGLSEWRTVKQGEVVRIDEAGLTVLRQDNNTENNFCDLERAYFLAAESDIETDNGWMSVEKFRERCGELLASQPNQPEVDFVIGVPTSGIPAATAYARKRVLPYLQLIRKNGLSKEGKRRTFQQDFSLQLIQSKVEEKLVIEDDKNIWDGKRVMFIDDSTIRGNVSSVLTRAMFKLGAKEVHIGNAFPPVIATCHLGVSMRTQEELVAWRNDGNLKDIAKEIGATSIMYITNENFVRARREQQTRIPEDSKEIFLVNGGCGGCITGIYPVDKNGVVYERKS